MTDFQLDQVTIAILAGGEGSRMGHPKAMLQVRGQPILKYLLEQFNWPGPNLLVSAPARQHPPCHDLFDREAVDAVSGQGPLRGILTALEASATEMILLTTVDMPEICHQHLAHLVAELTTRPAALGVMLKRSERVEPFPSIFHQTAKEMIKQRLDAGDFSVHSLSQTPKILAIPSPADWDERIWTNLNHPEELQTWLESI